MGVVIVFSKVCYTRSHHLSNSLFFFDPGVSTGMKSGTFEKTRINAVCNTLSGHEVAINCAMGLGIRKALL